MNKTAIITERKDYRPGEEVWVKAPELKATVLKRLDDPGDNLGIGPKWLVRDENHQLKQVYACEIEEFRDTQ